MIYSESSYLHRLRIINNLVDLRLQALKEAHHAWHVRAPRPQSHFQEAIYEIFQGRIVFSKIVQDFVIHLSDICFSHPREFSVESVICTTKGSSQEGDARRCSCNTPLRSLDQHLRKVRRDELTLDKIFYIPSSLSAHQSSAPQK
jgi:hypothetical protein